MPKTDAELVEDVRRGFDAARDELVRRYQRQMALVAAALVNDAAEGEDLSQEAFVRAFRNLDLLVDPSRFAPWLRRIVFGVSIDWLRSFRPDLYRGWDGAEEPAASATLSPLDHLLRDEMVQRVSSALASLPPRYRVPLKLFHLDGLSHAKIAGHLGVPVGTVRSLVARARRKLAPLLADYAPEAIPQVDELFEEQHPMTSAPNRFLHVANGSSTTGTIHAAGIPGLSSIWADALHAGPVPGDLSDDRLLEVRARYLAADAAQSLDETTAELSRWRAIIDDDAAYDELILWYEHDLFDQLNLLQVLCRIGRRRPTPKPVSLICIGAFPGRPDFKGLGELTPDELASLLETRQPVTEAQYACAERAWLAFRASDPRELEEVVAGDTSALPFLGAALRRHLEEFPWTVDGLSRSERRLLELARPAPVDVRAAFPGMHVHETAFYIADQSFWELVQQLALATPPLVAIDVASAVPHQFPHGTIALTGTGRAVLGGTVDRVARCGLDRWLGGVHLQGHGPLWRWDPAAGRITHA